MEIDMTDLTKMIESLLEAKTPVAIIDKDVIDLDKYVEVYSDGQFSDTGEKWYWRKETKSLVCINWSNWQGASNKYRERPVTVFAEMGVRLDEEHFPRWTKGMKIVFS